LLFRIRTYAINRENDFTLAFAVAKSGLAGWKYQLPSYSEQDPGIVALEALNSDILRDPSAIKRFCREAILA
jgi:hypothetical protein